MGQCVALESATKHIWQMKLEQLLHLSLGLHEPWYTYRSDVFQEKPHVQCVGHGEMS